MSAVIEDIELAVAHATLDGDTRSAWRLASVCESVYRGDTVWAVILANAYGFPAEVIARLSLDLQVLPLR